MAAWFIARANLALRRLEIIVNTALGQQFPPSSFAIVGVAEPVCLGLLGGSDYNSKNVVNPSLSLEELLKDGILWAAPRNRRTIEKRLKRKFGSPEQVYKLMLPKTNLLVCNSCGHHYEAGVLCPHCYEKVCKETTEMQDAVQAELGLSPVDKEVIVLYEGEKQHQPDEFWKGKRIVEMKKPRPAWFSKNLLQQTTEPPATTTDVKPTELA